MNIPAFPRRTMLILAIVFLVSSLAVDLISPVWPIFINSTLGASMTELGFLFAISNAVAAVMQIPAGFLSDMYGRKRLHVLGSFLAVFPPLIYILAVNWLDLVPWVMLSGFATGLYLPIRWAIVADVSSSDSMASAYSWTNISWLIGSTAAPFLGGILADLYGIHSPFIICFLLRFSVVPLTLLIEETRRKPQINPTSHPEVQTTIGQRNLYPMIVFSVINIVQGLGMGVTGPIFPIFAISSFAVDYTFIGILFAVGFGIASMIVQLPGSRCSDMFDRRKVMFVTFLASSPFFLIFAFSRSSIEMILFMFLSNAILNLSWSPFQTLMMDSTPPSKWGLVNGISAMTFWIGILIGNTLSGILWDSWGMLAPFSISSIAIALSAFPLILLKETKSSK